MSGEWNSGYGRGKQVGEVYILLCSILVDNEIHKWGFISGGTRSGRLLLLVCVQG